MNGSGSLQDAEPIFRAVLESGGTFTLKPRGYSMCPTIIPGRDSVSMVRLDGPASLYDILLYKRQNGNFVLHRVAKIARDGTYTMCGDNQSVLEPGIRQEDVVGVVTVIHLPSGDLVRGTPEFLAPARRRARSRPLRRMRSLAARLWHKIIGK